MKVVVLAGGSGTRLWPYSRNSCPKQFLKLLGERSFLQETVWRSLALVAKEDIFLVTHSSYLNLVQKQMNEVDSSIEILLEPMSKNTAPALAFVIKELLHKGISPEEAILVLPSDHLISPLEKFAQQMKEALPSIENGLVTFGFHPTHPETGYGYIQKEEGRVIFIEKPSLKRAQELLLKGDVYWNSGMFLFSVKQMLAEMKEHAPSLYHYVQGEVSFEDLDPISIDYAILEKSSSVQMMPLALTWSDVGSWDSVYEVAQKDAQGNACKGNVYGMGIENCLVYAEQRLVACIGVRDLCVIETGDALLVMQKGEAQRVKGLVEGLKRARVPEGDEHKTIYKPWGSYTILGEGIGFKIKEIMVSPYQSLSLQRHIHRSEHWVVVSGVAKVTVGEGEEIVYEKESVFVPKLAVHRVSNPGAKPLKLIEVQIGEYLGEDDIVRFADVYGRI